MPRSATLLKSVSDKVIPCLTKLVNKSLHEGSMEYVKKEIIDPLIKKIHLDSDIFNNYRPVSNLVFISKIIERVVLKRLDDYMNKDYLQSTAQYGYKKGESTEIMLLEIVNNVLVAFNENKATVILFLGLSAAFDTIDIQKLLHILSNEIGIRGTALQWFNSFLSGRTQHVHINGAYSDPQNVLYGVPQGSVLGPTLFSIYTPGLSKQFHVYKFDFSSYADDSNGRKSFS